MLFSVLKKLNFDGTLEIVDSNDKIYKFGNSNPHVCIRLKNKSIERKLFLNPSPVSYTQLKLPTKRIV